MRCAREGGIEALRRHPPPGPATKLTRSQLAQLPSLLAPGAEAYGYRGDVWSTKRVAEVIWRTFGVSYHPAHVSRLLRAVRLSVQQPVERATQRDEQAIAAWRDEQWPALKKSGRGTTHDRLDRSIGILSAADGGAHLGPTWADAGPAGQADARPPVGHQWHHAGWAALHADPRPCLQQ